MKLLKRMVSLIAIPALGFAGGEEVPFENVESWMRGSETRSVNSEITPLQKAALIHGINRRDFNEGSKQRSLGYVNYAASEKLLNSINYSSGGAVDSVISGDETHFFYYSSESAASVRATLAWLEESNSNLDVRIMRNGGFVRPWSQDSEGKISREQNDTRSTVERVDTEIKRAEDFVVQVSLRDKEKESVPYALLVSGGVFSERQLRLRSNLEMFKVQGEEKAKRVVDYLRDNGGSKDTVLESGTLRSLIDVVDGKPIYYETFNLDAAKSTSTEKLWPGGSSGLNLDGSGLPRSIGIWDGGTVLTSHREFGGRVVKGDNGDIGNHGTHVAGTMVATGVDPDARGMANKAKLVSYDWNYDDQEMHREAQSGLSVSQHSYGQTGNIVYTNNWDIIANDNPFYLISKSAGNESNYQTVSNNGNAKNVMTVGSAVDQPNGYQGPSVKKSSFSSEGPAPDYRIKPEIMANGSQLWSTNSSGSYESMSGTSMAGPAHAGSVALLQELWYTTHGNTNIRSATVRALVCGTADEMGSEGPSYSTGFGYMNALRAAELIKNNNGGEALLITENSLSNGETFTLPAQHITGEDIAVTIAWNDPAPSSSQSQGTSRKLINDLDIRINIDGQEYLPWAMDINSSTCYKGDNDRDNIEKIQIPASAGKNVEISVSHKGSLKSSTQDFSLVLVGLEANTDPYVLVEYPNGNEEFEQFSTETIRWRSNVDEPVDIILYKGSFPVDTIGSAVTNSGSFDWDIPEDLELGNNYSIHIECISSTDLNDKSDARFDIVSEYIITEFPWVEDFENYTSGETAVGKWKQEQKSDEIDWLVLHGITPTGQFGVDKGEGPGTGPLGDHTSGNGNYIYMEATDNYLDHKSCAITSPKINLEAIAAPKLSFWLQMNSKNNKMGSIDLDISVDGEWHEDVKTYSGHKGVDWFADTIDMAPYVGKRVQLRFYSTVGDSFFSDICLDDIQIEGSVLPVFKNLRDLDAKEGVELFHSFSVENGEDATASIVSGPDWLDLEYQNGNLNLSGTPAEGDAGEEKLILELALGGAVVRDSVVVTTDANSAPEFESLLDTTITLDEEFVYIINLSDIDSENELTIESSDLPDWLLIDDAGDGSATLTGTPTNDGNFTFTILGSDGVVLNPVEGECKIVVETPVALIGGESILSKGVYVHPSVITDGEKALFYLDKQDVASYSIKIHDAVGNTLFEKSGLVSRVKNGKSYCTSWNGTSQSGKAVSSGSYVAFLVTESMDGTKSYYKTVIGVKR